jgi:hypothetical protein
VLLDLLIVNLKMVGLDVLNPCNSLTDEMVLV